MAKKSASTGSRPLPRKIVPEPETPIAARKPRASKTLSQKKEPAAKAKPLKAAAKAKQSPAKSAKSAHAAKAAKPTKTKTKTTKSTGVVLEPGIEFAISAKPTIDDPIGDTTDGEGRYYLHGAEPDSFVEMAAYRADTADDALQGTIEVAAKNAASIIEPRPNARTDPEGRTQSPAEPSAVREPVGSAPVPASQPAPPRADPLAPEQPPAKLDRLQKILSQAGVASRRHAEEMILAGRVMVNGQVVSQLGAKADPARDHIKVDGKLIPAAERHRYFMLNKPRGFVTTVSDPEGRPTVMQFFSRMRERLYPVGRLDFESEGLLLVTNDGELANQLTRAASGVEKTYLVKIAGRPTEEELDRLCSGVFIERGQPGSDKAQTAPARIREFHAGTKHGSGLGGGRAGSYAKSENPWYEVVLIEGRNRELRKMFQSVGHFVEKIRRVGYGPLILDIEPGQLRELTPEELSRLRRAAEGKSRPISHPAETQRLFNSPRKEQAGRTFQPRGGQRPAEPGHSEQRFDRRAQGQRERFPARRGDRSPTGRAAASPPFQSRERGESQFRRFDSTRRPPGSGPRNQRSEPRLDPRRGGQVREPERGEAPRQNNRGPNRSGAPGFNRPFDRTFDRRPNRGAARPDRRLDRGLARGPGRPFGGPRKEIGRGEARTASEWPSRPSRFGPKRNEPNRGEPKRDRLDTFGPRPGASHPPDSDRFRSNRPGPPRSNSNRDPSKRGAARPFSPRPARDGGFRPGREGLHSPGRSPDEKYDSSHENPSRLAWKKSSPKSSPPRGAGAGFYGGKPKRNPPRLGGRKGS